MNILQIVGRKKSGKTSLAERLLPRLRHAGLSVATVKHSSHPHALDRHGSDSARHRQAGAEVTLVITSSSAALHFPVPGDSVECLELPERYLGGFDLVLIEGWAGRRGPKIEVLPAGPDGRPQTPAHKDADELLAVVFGPGVAAPLEIEGGLPCFAWEDDAALAAFIGEWLAGC